jgi:hypothetical protein
MRSEIRVSNKPSGILQLTYRVWRDHFCEQIPCHRSSRQTPWVGRCQCFAGFLLVEAAGPEPVEGLRSWAVGHILDRSRRGGSCVGSGASAGVTEKAMGSACWGRGCSYPGVGRRRGGWQEGLERNSVMKGPRGEVRHHARNHSRT